MSAPVKATIHVSFTLSVGLSTVHSKAPTGVVFPYKSLSDSIAFTIHRASHGHTILLKAYAPPSCTVVIIPGATTSNDALLYSLTATEVTCLYMMYNGLKGRAQFLNTVERTFINGNISNVIARLEKRLPVLETHHTWTQVYVQ